mmetsp:Transcript_5332/g.6482  ORF Transcript_5332/g.6482 Transcript_5332/m.6482 type:complete len:206 (-) Transcript_5332:12-629(-)
MATQKQKLVYYAVTGGGVVVSGLISFMGAFFISFVAVVPSSSFSIWKSPVGPRIVITMGRTNSSPLVTPPNIIRTTAWIAGFKNWESRFDTWGLILPSISSKFVPAILTTLDATPSAIPKSDEMGVPLPHAQTSFTPLYTFCATSVGPPSCSMLLLVSVVVVDMMGSSNLSLSSSSSSGMIDLDITSTSLNEKNGLANCDSDKAS